MHEIIKTESISRIYKTTEIETTALKKVSFSVNAGEFVAIMGPSGCGKSTLLNILGLIDQSDSGKYFFKGKDISGLGERQKADMRKENLGFIFQSFNLIDELNVYDNVELPLIYTKLSSKERKEKINHVLSQLDIIHRASHYPQQLSGGQQQRVAIARAIVNDPAVILADEPTGNLDSANGTEVMKVLSDLNGKGATIVMVTHSMHDAAYSNRKVHLFDGQIIKEDILKQMSHV
ncbi:MAG: phosphonate ABC transporter ATP-binding protein [Thalassobius sp.]|nr:phosphonate ABC transporter ATP-binding protein [Thalassovita sp.]